MVRVRPVLSTLGAGILASVLTISGCGNFVKAEGSEAPNAGEAGAGGAGGHPGGSDFSACSLNSQCVVVPQSCCGSCGEATRGDAIAVNAQLRDSYRASVCGDDVGCPACAGQPDPSLLGTCHASRCQLIDLYTHEASACNTASDCRVRARGCCECGAAMEVDNLVAIAIGGESGYAALVCDPQQACTECQPSYPDYAHAVCRPEGYCDVAYDFSPGSG